MTGRAKVKEKEDATMSNKEFISLAQQYHGRIEAFNDLIQFHEFSEDFQLQMFRLIDQFIQGDEVVLRIACLGCKGGGKSSNMILIALMILLTSTEDVLMFYISAKEEQSKIIFRGEVDVLLRKAKKYNAELNNVIELNAKSIRNKVTDKEISILTYATTSKGISTAGIHCDGIHLFILDEAPSLPEEVFNHIKGTVASGKSIYMVSGNPDDDKLNFFWHLMKDVEDGDYSKGWHRFNINYLDLKRPTEKQREGMLSNYPEGTTVYTKYVLGRYPDKEENVMIDHNLVSQCLTPITIGYDPNRIYHLDAHASKVMIGTLEQKTYIGVDISAGVGKDYTVITARTGHIIEILFYDKFTPMVDVLQRLERLYLMYGMKKRKMIFVIDGDGIGRPIPGILKNLGYQIYKRTQISHNSNDKTKVHSYYGDVRSGLYGQFASWLEEAKFNRELPDFATYNSQVLNYQILLRPDLKEVVTKKILNEARQTVFEYKEDGRKLLRSKNDPGLVSSPDILDSIGFTFLLESKLTLV